MKNNQNFLNKKYPQQISYHQQNNHYRSSERINYSPNGYHNSSNIIKNQNNNIKTKKMTKNNNNIYYINPNQINSSQNIPNLKQLKSKQQNQIYLEGDLNNFINNNNQPNIYISNLNKAKNNMNAFLENQNNNMFRTSHVEHMKNNRGLPRKSPIPIPKEFTPVKYLNNDNISNYSNNSNGESYHTANYQLLNNNYSISNLSQFSGYSNNSYNNQINFRGAMENGNIRAYFNNINSSLGKKRLNGSNSYNKYNINSNDKNNVIPQNKSSNILNKKNNISEYNYKVKVNNYINNNNALINTGIKKQKYISKSPNPQGNNLFNTIKRNNNNINPGSNYNMFNNSNISSANSSISNDSLFNKIAYRTSNFGSNHNNNLNQYENYNNYNNKINKNNQNYNGRPLTSHSYISKSKRNNNINNNMIMNQLGLNHNNININNYHSNDKNERQKLIYNNKNKNNINFIHEYNTNTNKRDYSANIPNNRINIDKMNNEYNNNFNSINQNPMVNLHIINKGQIINNNYNNNINNNSMNNNMNNLYVYKYNISQNNIISGKYNNNLNGYNMNNKSKNNNPIPNNINNMNDLYNNDDVNLNYNNINIERQNNHRYNKKGAKMRSNSSSGIGVSGELNNILNQRNNEKVKNLPTNQKKIGINKINHLNNNKPQNIKNNTKIKSPNPNKNPIIKNIKQIHHFTHVGFNGEKDKDFNQDIAFLERNFTGNNLYLYLAVCDGHGVEGHEVSGFIKSVLPKELSNSLYHKDILSNDKNLKKKIYNIIGETFIKVNEKLISNESINSIFSGSTCVSVIYTPIKLICANIGDSRAVLGRYDKNFNKWIAINLSRDHKPTEEDEARRILKKGGRIKPFIDEETGEEVGPQRVWVKDDEVPGLAMTRSFGDRVAAIAGTICIPEIKEYNFNEDDKFMILASDGVWEFIQNEECINIIGKFYLNNNIEGCCEFLYKESRKRWIKEEEVVDDITMLLIFFD